MRTTVSIGWRLLRGGGRFDITTQLLAAFAFVVSTCLLLLTVGVNLGFADRAGRQAWTTPTAAAPASTATAVASTRTDFYRGLPITVVTLAALTGDAPTPPGLPRFPTPGQLWLSPALTELVGSDRAALGDRWPGHVAGIVADRGLMTPDQLLVVIGTDANSPMLTVPIVQDTTRPQDVAGPVPIVDFSARPGRQSDPLYRDLSLIASVLLIVPLLVLGGAAARLGLARRDQRLAALRLVGASSRQIYGVVALEAAATALLGALAGALTYLALLPLASRMPFGGGTWFTADLWVGPGVLVAVLAAVAFGGVVSAVSTLRRVLVSPLGVTQRHAHQSRHLWRVLVFAVAVGGYWRVSRSAGPSVTALVVAFGIVFASLSLLGPGVLAVLGRAMVAGARGPARLIAGRRLLDDPKAAWRTVGGLALTGFIAGFLALFPSSSGQVVWGARDVINVAVPTGQLAQAQAATQAALQAAGLTGRVAGGTDAGALLGTSLLAPDGHAADGRRATSYLSVPVTAQDQERTRTALHHALPGLPAATGTDLTAQDDLFGNDMHRASTAVLIASFLIAIASAGITACAAVLDRRRTYQQLHLAGMPLRLLDQARRRETTGPVLLLVLGSLGTGLLSSAPITKLGLGGGQLDNAGLAVLAVTVAAGLAGVRLACAASRPLLRTVATSPTSRD